MLFKMPPSIVLKCGQVFLSARRLWCALRRKHAPLGLSYSGAHHKVSVNGQQYVLNKVSINRNTHKYNKIHTTQ